MSKYQTYFVVLPSDSNARSSITSNDVLSNINLYKENKVLMIPANQVLEKNVPYKIAKNFLEIDNGLFLVMIDENGNLIVKGGNYSQIVAKQPSISVNDVYAILLADSIKDAVSKGKDILPYLDALETYRNVMQEPRNSEARDPKNTR